MKFILEISIIFISTFLGSTTCDRILFLFPIASKSHRNVFEPLINALAARGHDLTVVTPFRSKNLPSNIKEVIPISAENILLAQFQDPFELRKSGRIGTLIVNMDSVLKGCHKAYENVEFQETIKQEYDLVIINGFVNTCFDGVLHKIGAPHIIITTMAAPSFITEFTGNHLPSSFVPNPFFAVGDNMNFLQRVINWTGNHLIKVIFLIYYKPMYENIYRKYLGADIPGIDEIQSNVSLVLMNSHFSLTYPRPNLPDNIEVGGMHCRPAEAVPKVSRN